jgi:hypothetical protein
MWRVRICARIFVCSLTLAIAFSAGLSARADIKAQHHPEPKALRADHKRVSPATKDSEAEIPLPIARPALVGVPPDGGAEIPMPIARPTLANLLPDNDA